MARTDAPALPTIIVNSQAALDAHQDANPDVPVLLTDNGDSYLLDEPIIITRGIVHVGGQTAVKVSGKATVYGHDSAFIDADGAIVEASDRCTVTAVDCGSVKVFDDVTLTASGTTWARAYEYAQVTASGAASVTAYGSATVTADCTDVSAYGHSRVFADGSTKVHAEDQAHVTARGSAVVTATWRASVAAFDAVKVHVLHEWVRVDVASDGVTVVQG